MSLRDWIDRITGRRPGRRYAGPTRSRSEPTIQLPKEHRGGDAAPPGAARAVTAPENRFERGPGPRPYSQPTPALGQAAVRGAARNEAEDPAGPNADTQYHQTAPPYKKDEVVGVLAVVDGELKGEVFPLFDGENKLGRSTSADVVLPSKWISREHAMVVHSEGVFAIVPLTEKNRTYVNDREVDGSELSDGDTIRLGRTTFRFRSVEGL